MVFEILFVALSLQFYACKKILDNLSQLSGTAIVFNLVAGSLKAFPIW